MRHFASVAFLILLLINSICAAHADAGYPPVVTEKKLHATNDLRGLKAPQLEVEKWLNGKSPQTKNKVVILEFWATWCPDCRRLTPELNRIAEKFAKDIVVIGVSDEPESTVQKYLDANSVKFNVACAPDRKMYKLVGVTGIPQVLVISKDNIVRWQGYADDKNDPLTDDKLAMIINASKHSRVRHSRI